MGRIIKTGIIGFGLSGKVFHAPFIHAHPGFHLKKIVERKGGFSKTIYPEVQIVKDYHELLEDNDLDLIVIAVPNLWHFAMAKDILESGKHVVVEKPFTPTSQEAEELIRISGNTGNKIFVYQNRRWDGDFMTVKKVVKQDLLGELLEYEAHFDRFSPERKRAAWRDEPLPASGVLYDLGPHLVDQALVLFGRPDAVFADIRTQRPGMKVDDYFELKLFYKTLKVTLKSGIFVKEPGPAYVMHGKKGSFVKYGRDPQEEMLKSGMIPGGENWGLEDPSLWGFINSSVGGLHFEGTIETEAGNYMGFYDNVRDVILNNAEMSVKPEEARDVIRIIELAFESHSKKTIISFKE